MYGKAIAELSRSLRCPDSVHSDALLAAVKLLGRFEVCRRVRILRKGEQ